MTPPDCKHWRDAGIAGQGRCAIGLFGGAPSFGVCAACIDSGVPRESRGLGDDVERLIHFTVGGFVKHCDGCGRRQAALNRIRPRKPGTR